jgi:hypothetical protein
MGTPSYFGRFDNFAFAQDEAGVLQRGIEIASKLAAKPALSRSVQKQTLNINLRRRITQDVPFGMALEGVTAADLPYQKA